MKLRNHRFIDEHLPDAWIDGNTLLYIDHDGRAYGVKGFVVQGQPMNNLSLEHLAMWRAAAQAMLNSLECTTHVDFYWTVENDYSSFLEGHRKGLDPGASPLAAKLLDQRIATYERLQAQNQLRHRKLFVFINFAPQESRLKKGDEVKKSVRAGNHHRLLLSEWQAARLKLSQLTDLARHPFESCGMNTFPLESQDFRRIFRQLLSPWRKRLGVPEAQTGPQGRLWNEILHSDVERKPPFLHFDEHHHAFISMTNLPQETRTGFLQHLFTLSHPDYAIKVTFRTTDKQAEIRHLQSDYGSKKGLQKARERDGKVIQIEMETQAEEIQNEIRTLTQTPQQIFHVQMLLHLWHPEEDELRSRLDEAILKIGYCGGIQSTVENIAAPEALRAFLPGWTREERLDRFQIVKSVNAADFIPAHTDFIGTGRPQLLFPTPEGGLMTAHVFTQSRPFHNVIVGETGGGKTFLINSIITQLVSQGLQGVSVISTKNEFGPLMAVYGGEVISFHESNPVFLNPCSIARDAPTQDELSSMTAILETIFGDENDDGKRKIRQSRILKAAGLSFGEHGRKTRLRHLVKAFREGWDHDDHRELEKLAMILEPYCFKGLYGEFFDSDTRKPLNLSCPFKFFDFSGIQKNKNLSAVMMMALTMAEAARLASLPKAVRKALVLDECWAFVDSSAGGDFIENALRVYRAFNSAVFLSTQVITDFLQSRISHVVMANCHNFFLLRTRDHQAISKMQKELNLTDQLVGRFASMPDPAEAGYSHFLYVHRAETQAIAGEAINQTSREEALLYSTSPHVSELRDEALRRSSDPWGAIVQLSKTINQGKI